MPALVGQEWTSIPRGICNLSRVDAHGLPGVDGEGVPAALVAIEGCISCCGVVGAKVGKAELEG